MRVVLLPVAVLRRRRDPFTACLVGASGECEPMNQEQHKAEAERLLGEASALIAGGYPQTDGHPLAGPEFWAALTHAVLATVPDRPTSARWPSCRCPQYRTAHIWGAGCPAEVIADPMVGATPMPPPVHRRRWPCQETNYDEYGDCDGPVVEVEQVETRYGLVRGSRLFLCRSHRTQAIERGAVRAFHPSQISDGPGS